MLTWKLTFIFYCFALFICLPNSYAAQISINDIAAIKDPKKQMETAITLSWNPNFGRDTIQQPLELKQLLRIKNPKIKLVYYLLLADLYSVSFDQCNERSKQYFTRAENYADSLQNPALAAMVAIRYGAYYHTYRQTVQAMPYFLNASTLLQTTPLTQIPLANVHMQFLASFYAYLDMPKEANSFLTAALHYARPHTREKINTYTMLGLNYFNLKEYKHAETFYNLAYLDAQMRKDSVWIGIVNGYLANIAAIKLDHKRALALTQSNVYYAYKHKEHLNYMHASLDLADRYISLKEWGQAKEAIAQAMHIFENKPYFIAYKYRAYQLLTDITLATKDKDQALEVFQKQQFYAKAMDRDNNILSFQKSTWERAAQNHQNTIEKNKLTYQKNFYISLIISLLAFICMATILFFINRSRQKIIIKSLALEKEQMQLILAKKASDSALEEAREAMEQFIVQQQANDQTIEDLKLLIENEQNLTKEQSLELQINLDQLLNSHLMTDEKWIHFKLQFNTLYPNYIKEQQQEFPQLSDYHLRLLVLQKLELSNQSMANLLGITVAGIKKAKQRFYAKYPAAKNKTEG